MAHHTQQREVCSVTHEYTHTCSQRTFKLWFVQCSQRAFALRALSCARCTHSFRYGVVQGDELCFFFSDGRRSVLRGGVAGLARVAGGPAEGTGSRRRVHPRQLPALVVRGLGEAGSGYGPRRAGYGYYGGGYAGRYESEFKQDGTLKGVGATPERSLFAGLLMAQRLISAVEYAAFQSEWARATQELDRTLALSTLADSVECALDYVGITAVEDRLQHEVPGTIAAVRAAGMRFWVLTGDKVETAVSIAYSSNIFEHGMKVTNVANPTTRVSLIEDLQAAVAERHMALSHGLVLDGQCVDILEDGLGRKSLMDLSMDITSCVACRLSPSQKRKLLRLVCDAHSGTIAVAIGDGANDVPMLQAAHIGVGIRGMEGTAAVLASDVAVSEFRFLKILLLCHMRRFYRRVALFLLWYNYKRGVT